MHIHILSLFGESMRTYLDTSIMKRAQEKGLFRYTLHNLTDWSVRNTRRVDDRPYGGGAGTILTVEPLRNAINTILDQYGTMPIIFFSPQGETLTQTLAETWSTHTSCLLICGHYEGVDARIFELFPITEISIGRYVLSSGELAALVWIDSVVRLIP